MPIDADTKKKLAEDRAKRAARKRTLDRNARRLADAAAHADRAVAVRDEAIRDAVADGIAAATIAEAVGLTRQRVWQIANTKATS